MKLCIIVGNSLRKDPRVIKQIKCAIDNGIDIHFIGYKDENYRKDFLENLECAISIVDVGDKYTGHLNSVWKKLYRQFLFYYYPIKWIIKIKPDVIHANDFDTLIPSYIASIFCGAKVLYDSHEICAENTSIVDKKLQRRFLILSENFILKRIGGMISVSNAAAMYFRNKYKIPLPTVITNVPYRSKNLPHSMTTKKSLEVLYQGQMYLGRGYEEFVKSAEFIDENITLVLRGYGIIENELKKIVSENNLDKKVRFDGPVEVRDIVIKASESDLGIVLTQPVNINFELTVSNKLFEYIHASLPVILSDVPEHRYLNDKYNFGVIVTDFSPKGIAECINNLLADPIKYKLLKDNAIKAAKILCWENESQKLLALYKNLSKN